MSHDIRRIGLLVPSADIVVESDFHRFVPEGVVFHTARMFQGRALRVTLDTLDQILQGAETAAESVAHAQPELVCFCCTSASFMKGYGTDVELARRIEAVAKVPATTTTTAVVQALEALDIRRMFLLTPYPEDFNKLELRFFTDHGVEIPRYATYEEKWGIGRLETTSEPRRVVIVGGGPGGLKTAETAGLRGHDVTLLERSDRLGGQVLVAAAAMPYRDEFANSTRFLESQIERLAIDLIQGCPVPDGE